MKAPKENDRNKPTWMHFRLSFFFFSSRRRHTRCGRDWSSDVCSSDLLCPDPACAQPGLSPLRQPSRRLLGEVSRGLGTGRVRAERHVQGQEQRRPRRHHVGPGAHGRVGSRRPCVAARREGPEQTATRLAALGPRAEGDVHHGQRAESGDGKTPHADRRPLLRGARWQARDRRPRVSRRRRQRRRVQVDHSELPVEVKSLYREPERQEIDWGPLELIDVFRIYSSGPSETVALRGLDLRVEPRELVAVFGPSGSGKSTMLQLAGGLDQPSAGEVRVFGRPLGRLDEDELAHYRARDVAIVFQSGNLWPWLSARENVALALRLADVPTARADDALAAFGLGKRGGQRAGALSGR